MMDFFASLFIPQFTFLRYALLGSLLIALPAGFIGTWVVLNRLSYVAGSISHASLSGIGLVLFLNALLGWAVNPLAGALVSAVLASLLISSLSLWGGQREDTAISAVWVAGMGLGMLFLQKTPGYVNPSAYLFGNILIIKQGDLILLLIIDFILFGLFALFFQPLKSIGLDKEYASSRGLPVKGYLVLLNLLIALAVVMLVRVVGIVMAIAMLTLPAATAALFSRRIGMIMIIAAVLSAFYSFLGLYISFDYSLPAGSVTVLLASFFYLAGLGVKKLIK